MTLSGNYVNEIKRLGQELLKQKKGNLQPDLAVPVMSITAKKMLLDTKSQDRPDQAKPDFHKPDSSKPANQEHSTTNSRLPPKPINISQSLHLAGSDLNNEKNKRPVEVVKQSSTTLKASDNGMETNNSPG